MTTEPSATELFLKQSLTTVRREYQEKRDRLDELQGKADAIRRQIDGLKTQRDELVRDMRILGIEP